MTDKTVWFGTEEKMGWIPAPSPGVGRSTTRWRVGGQFLNGGQWRKESASGSRTCSLQWPVMTGDKVRKITAFLEGSYGDGPFYYSDPFSEGVNSAPQWLAAPWLATKGAPAFTPNPVQIDTPANTRNYPSYGARYAVTPGTSKTVRLPVPEGYTAHIGAHGQPVGVLPAQSFTNYAINPGFENVGSFIEIWRNHCLNPRQISGGSTSEFQIRFGWTPAYLTGVVIPGSGITTAARSTCPSNTTVPDQGVNWGGNVSLTNPGTSGDWLNYPMTPGVPMKLFTRVRLGLSGNVTVRLRYHDGAGNWVGASESPLVVPLTAGVWTAVSVPSFTPPAGATHAVFGMFLNATSGTFPAGVAYDQTACCVTQQAAPAAWFDSTFSPDPDLTAFSVGTVNNSPSRLSAPVIANQSASGGVSAGIASQQWAAHGTQSMRIIPQTSTPALTSFSMVAGSSSGMSGLGVTFVAGQTYTILATCRLAAPLTGTLNSRARSITPFWGTGVANPQPNVQAPNAAGVHPLRLTFTIPSGVDRCYILLYNGASAGQGDVWWDDFAVVAGNYPEDWFSGDSPNIYGTFTWNGASNNSSSTAVFSGASFQVNNISFPLLSVDTDQLTNSTVTGPAFADLKLEGTGNIGLNGVMVRLLPTGSPAPTGPWVKGEGYTGLRLDNDPQITGYSSAQDRQAVSADFVEVDPWV